MNHFNKTFWSAEAINENDSYSHSNEKICLRNVPGITLKSGERGAHGDSVNLRGLSIPDSFFLDGVRDGRRTIRVRPGISIYPRGDTVAARLAVMNQRNGVVDRDQVFYGLVNYDRTRTNTDIGTLRFEHDFSDRFEISDTWFERAAQSGTPAIREAVLRITDIPGNPPAMVELAMRLRSCPQSCPRQIFRNP